MQRWHASRGDENFSVELAETRIRFTRDTGTRQSFGGHDMPYPRFLRSTKWHEHVREIFGDQVLDILLSAARAYGAKPD